jgi:hypothetical protein
VSVIPCTVCGRSIAFVAGVIDRSNNVALCRKRDAEPPTGTASAAFCAAEPSSKHGMAGGPIVTGSAVTSRA